MFILHHPVCNRGVLKHNESEPPRFAGFPVIGDERLLYASIVLKVRSQACVIRIPALQGISGKELTKRSGGASGAFAETQFELFN